MKYARPFLYIFMMTFAGGLFGGITACYAQQRIIERIYITTDREYYIAGESVWLSLYCFDATNGRNSLSDLSNVAYLELHNTTAVVLTVKLRIAHGRGSGKLDLPVNIPTGNYRLIAYTKQMRNESQLKYFEKIIPVYNTLSSERSPDNVVTEEDASFSEYTPSGKRLENTLHGIKIDAGIQANTAPRNSSFPISIQNNGQSPVTFSITVSKIDTEETDGLNLSNYLMALKKEDKKIVLSEKFTPEYEGEIIKGKVRHPGLSEQETSQVFLSSPGQGADVYISEIDKTAGEITFYTGSIYGNREVVLEYSGNEHANDGVSFEISDPFVRPATGPMPKLYMQEKYRSSLMERSIEMQVGKRFGLDTLFETTLFDDDPLLYTKPAIYKLDNYTRFPDMNEIMIEFVTELKFRKNKERTVLQVDTRNNAGVTTSSLDALVLMDGVVVLDHQHILEYDPLRIESIAIYRKRFFIGKNSFGGIVKFNTYRGDYAGLTFSKNVRILDFQGVQYPCKFTGGKFKTFKDIPDKRSLLYWDPQVDINTGENAAITVWTSSVPGKYVISLEGVTSDGRPIYYKEEISVK